MNTPKSTSLFILATASLLFLGCKTGGKGSSGADIVIKGSETELPLISNFADEFQAQNHLAVSVSGGGSNSGLRELMANTIDIANSSRVITEEEKENLKGKKVKWVQVIIGSDAIAIITNRTFQIESLSLAQLSDIFSGKVTNWKEVGGPDKPIDPYGRNANSGTHDYVMHRLNIDKYRPQMKEFDTYAEIIENVKKDPNAIAYVSASCLKRDVPVREQDVHAVNVFMKDEDEFSPFNEEAINSGEYALVRPLFQYYDSSSVNPWIKKFIDFEISKGDSLLKKNGYYPINVFHKQINSFQGALK